MYAAVLSNSFLRECIIVFTFFEEMCITTEERAWKNLKTLRKIIIIIVLLYFMYTLLFRNRSISSSLNSFMLTLKQDILINIDIFVHM